MPKTLFEELQQTKLTTEVLVFLEETAHVLARPDTAEPMELAKRREQLKNYLNNNVSDRLKRAIHKTLAEIDEHIPEEAAMEDSTTRPEFLIQIPSAVDLSHMHCMPAGGDEDQQQRLTHMSELVIAHSSLPTISTDGMLLSIEWYELFNAIDKGAKEEALTLLAQLAEEDSMLQLITHVHTLNYVQKLIAHCIDAQAKGLKALPNDIIITPKTFELLIKDLATTLQHQSSFYFSFGLPSHHAYSNEGRGFCLFNKTAILLSNATLTHTTPLSYVIIGTDVNRDNGLCQVLRDSASELNITHIDVFDSRVYPGNTLATVGDEFSEKPVNVAEGIVAWQHHHYCYLAVDLSLQIKAQESIYPALLFAIAQLQHQLQVAQDAKQQIMLLLPMGWDSHEKEGASCGKFIVDRWMTKTEARKQRFNNTDLVYFYEQVLQLYKENKESIAGVYWGLEGGYDRAMYEQQITLMLTTVCAQLAQEQEQEHTSAIAPR